MPTRIIERSKLNKLNIHSINCKKDVSEWRYRRCFRRDILLDFINLMFVHSNLSYYIDCYWFPNQRNIPIFQTGCHCGVRIWHAVDISHYHLLFNHNGYTKSNGKKWIRNLILIITLYNPIHVCVNCIAVRAHIQTILA